MEPDDREHLRTLLKYLTRSPVALDRLHYYLPTASPAGRPWSGSTSSASLSIGA